MAQSAFTGISAVRMIWQDGNLAIGETYYNTFPPSQSGSGLYVLAMNLFKARSLLMGASVVPVSVRMSIIGVRRGYIKCANADVQPVPVGNIAINVQPSPAFAGSNSINLVDGSAAQGPDAILTDAYGSVATSHAKKYLSGCPNVLIRTNPAGPYVSGDPAWYTLFLAYGAILVLQTNGWVMKTVVPVVQSPANTVVAYSLSGSNQLQVTLPNLGGSIGVGTILTIHGMQMTSRAYKAANGNFRVAAPPVAAATVGQTIYTLSLPFANRFPYILIGTGYVGVQLFMADTYSAVNLGREGEHKRGNSVLAPRGRRRTVQQISS